MSRSWNHKLFWSACWVATCETQWVGNFDNPRSFETSKLCNCSMQNANLPSLICPPWSLIQRWLQINISISFDSIRLFNGQWRQCSHREFKHVLKLLQSIFVDDKRHSFLISRVVLQHKCEMYWPRFIVLWISNRIESKWDYASHFQWDIRSVYTITRYLLSVQFFR